MGRTRMGRRGRIRNPAGRGTLVLAASILCVLTACSEGGEPQTGRVAVRVTDHRAGIEDFTTLHVTFAAISLHRRREPRGTGWVELLRSTPAVDIVPLKDGRSAPVGAERIETGRYDALRVRFGDIQGTLRRGGLVNVAPIGTTIAVDLDVQAESRRAVLIDLYVEDQTDHQPGRYALKIQEITVGEERE